VTLDDSGDINAPQVAIDESGGAVVVYSQGFPRAQVLAREISAQGTIGPVQVLSDLAHGVDTALWITMNQSGRVLAVWNARTGRIQAAADDNAAASAPTE
jgi:hypothetical protein